jgi:lysophospholipase L1-like esterase
MTSAEGKRSSATISLGMTAEGEIYTIYILGDSTACEWTYNYPLTGWGQVFGYFFDENVVIKNEALSARSSKSFYNDHWAPIRDVLQPGDFVFIQFGINDNKPDDPTRHTEPWSTFQDYLSLFVEESQAKGAFPVILTPVRRNSWTNDSTVYDAWHDYPVAARALARELEVSLIDVDSLSAPLYEGLGPDYTGPFMYMNLEPGEYPAHPDGYSDNVHFQEMGAIEIARLVTEAIGNAVEDTILNRLIPHIKPMHKVAVSTNFPDETLFTRTAIYPYSKLS